MMTTTRTKVDLLCVRPAAETAETIQKSGQMLRIFLFTMAGMTVAIFVLLLWVGEMFDWIQLFKDVFTNKAKKH